MDFEFLLAVALALTLGLGMLHAMCRQDLNAVHRWARRRGMRLEEFEPVEGSGDGAGRCYGIAVLDADGAVRRGTARVAAGGGLFAFLRWEWGLPEATVTWDAGPASRHTKGAAARQCSRGLRALLGSMAVVLGVGVGIAAPLAFGDLGSGIGLSALSWIVVVGSLRALWRDRDLG